MDEGGKRTHSRYPIDTQASKLEGLGGVPRLRRIESITIRQHRDQLGRERNRRLVTIDSLVNTVVERNRGRA